MDPNIIDDAVFGQLLEMDEEGDNSFSKSLIEDYFDQADSTFDSIQNALNSENCKEASQLGHFLKGSSAALGVIKVRNSCEKIQHVGNLHNSDGSGSITVDDALPQLQQLLQHARKEFEEAKDHLKQFYDFDS